MPPLVDVVNTPQGDQALLWLLTFTDPEPDNTIVLRAVNNLEAVTSRGNVYEAFPFNVVLPPDDGQKITAFQLSFPNVGRELMQLVREYDPGKNPRVKMGLVLSDTPDVVEKLIDFMTVDSVNYTALDITFQLTSSSIFARKTCTATYNQIEFPGLFWGLR